MTHATITVYRLTRRILDFEAAQIPGSENASSVELRALVKLRSHLAKLIGPEGFSALLGRALTLAQSDHPWLTSVKIKEDDLLDVLARAANAQDRETAVDGYAALMTHLFSLLILFIGDALCLRLLHEVWPEMNLDQSDLSSSEEKE